MGVSLTEKRKISDVEKVEDRGDCYYFKFIVGKTWDFFLCQKDLISKGTIEEFEEKFADKIVRNIEITK